MLIPEGRIPVLASAVCAGLVSTWAGMGWSAPLWLVVAFTLYLFRDSRPIIPPLPLAIISPADGRMRACGLRRDPWLHRDALGVTVKMPFPGISLLRSPTEGKVMDYWAGYAKGEPEQGSPTRYALWVQTDEGNDVVYAVVTAPWSRYRSNVSPGERIGQGQRCGFIYFARWVDVYMPVDAEVDGQNGKRVTAGADVIARLKTT